MRNRIKVLFITAFMALSLAACGSGNSIVENADTEVESTAMFERHRLDDCYSILVDKETGVCYLESSEIKWLNGITVMLNADGTPKIWEGYQKEKSD